MDVSRLIQEASLSDLCYILSSFEAVKKRRTTLLFNKSYEVVKHHTNSKSFDIILKF